MSEDPDFSFRKYKIKILRLEKEIQQLKKENLRLRRRLDFLVHQVKERKKIEAIEIPKQEKISKAKIYFKINSEDEIKDLVIFSELYRDLEKMAEENKIKLEYKLKKGSIDVVLTVIISLVTSTVGGIASIFIIRAIDRIRSTPHVEITKLDSTTKENLARQNHSELRRSFKGIVEKTSINEDGRTGTQYTIRDNNDVDWRYNIYDNGDSRALP